MLQQVGRRTKIHAKKDASCTYQLWVAFRRPVANDELREARGVCSRSLSPDARFVSTSAALFPQTRNQRNTRNNVVVLSVSDLRNEWTSTSDSSHGNAVRRFKNRAFE